MIDKRTILLYVVLLTCANICAAAQQVAENATTIGRGALPIVTFTLDFPQSSPAHYSLSVDSTGRALYISGQPPNPAEATDQSFRYEFTVSEQTRKQILELSRRANYFRGELERGKGKIANTGKKTLTYRDDQRNNSASFNYSNNAAVQELTRIFQSISATIEFADRLDQSHRYQKLALDEQLKQMEELVKGNSLMEVQAIAPILKGIIADQTVVNATRARAERILLTVNLPSK